MRPKYLIVLIIFFLPAVALAESRKSFWLGTFAKKGFSEKLSAWIETQMRYNFDQGGTNQILYRTGLLQEISKKQELGYLYGYIQSSALKEHRFALQHSLSMNSFLSHRARLESRQMEDGKESSMRFRYLLKGQSSKKRSRYVVWNELFLNLNKTSWNGHRTFERNRLFLGRRRQFDKIAIEYGYLNQFVPRSRNNITEHIAVLYFFI